MNEADFPWRQDFNGLAPGSPEFDAAWSKLGSQEPDRFREAQRSFGQKRYFEPAAKRLAEQCGLDVKARSRTLQEIVFAFSIRTGPAVPPIVRACKSLQDEGAWSLTDPGLDEAIIRRSYENLISMHFASKAELEAALEQLKNEMQQPNK